MPAPIAELELDLLEYTVYSLKPSNQQLPFTVILAGTTTLPRDIV